jgi:hypothetical protein
MSRPLRLRHLLLAVGLALAPLLAGATTTILAAPDRLKPADDGSSVLHWIKPGADFRSYDKLLLEAIRLPDGSGEADAGINPADLRELADYFRAAVRKEADAGGFQVVSDPGPGVLRMRIALLELKPNQPVMGLIVLAAPFGTVAEAAATTVISGKPGSAPYMGSAGVEIQLSDAQSSEVLVEVRDLRAGTRYSIEGGLEGAARSYVEGLSVWGYARQSIDLWARWLRNRLQALKAAPA